MKLSKNSVNVETSNYRFSLGHAPKGFGTWAFGIGKKNPEANEIVWVVGKYSDAKKQAVAIAAERGVSTVYVLA